MSLIPNFILRRIAHRPELVKIVDNIGWLFFDKILRMGVGLFVGVWVARYLGPEQFGQLNFATAFTALFGAVATLGLPGIVVRDIVQNPSCKEETLGTAALLHLMGGVLSYGLIIGVIFWMRPDDPSARTLVAIVGAVMLLKAGDVAVYWFESQVQSKYTVWVRNSVFLGFATIKAGLILLNAPLVAFAWAMMTEALVLALLMLLMLGLCGPRLSKLNISFNRAKILLSDSLPLVLSGIAVMIYIKIDQIMLGQMIGDEAVGIYSAAVQVSEVWYFVPMAIVASVFPSILEAKKRSEKLYYDRLQQLYDLMVWFATAVALPMTFLSTVIVTSLFGDAYGQAGSVLSIHIWATVFLFLGVASAKWFLAENQQFFLFQRAVIGAAANVILNLVLIPQFGVLGAAWATVISYSIALLFSDLIHNETRRMFLMKINAFNLVRALARISTLHKFKKDVEL